ncbi:hypothetical protein [Nocardioides sp.]|uniref:hypothetical protein n=1 Tax=Nocardioides sp. TaxID=35761 RepID=UPI003513CCBB
MPERTVVPPCRVDPTGRLGPTRARARGRGWRRVGPGLYVPADTDSTTFEQRVVEVAAGLPEAAAITGIAALRWIGVEYLSGLADRGDDVIDVAVDDRAALAPRPGVRLTNDWLFEADRVVVDGVALTRVARSVSFAVRRARSLSAAVRILDMALRADVVDLAEMQRYAAGLRCRPEVRQLRTALEFADENAWSPMETVMRLEWVEAMRRRPLTNRPVFHLDGRLLVPDLLDPEWGVAGEYDGDVHNQTRVRERDHDRDELYRDLGLQVARMTSTDLRAPFAFVRRLRAAYGRAELVGRSSRCWTLAPPSGWTVRTTVAARRAAGDAAGPRAAVVTGEKHRFSAGRGASRM